MPHAELEDLVERDDTAARLPAAATRLKEAVVDECSVSTDVESAVPEAESAEVRCGLHSLCRYHRRCSSHICTILWHDGSAEGLAVRAVDAPCAGSGLLRPCWWSSRP